MVARVTARYSRGLFHVAPAYEANNDFLRGTVSAMGSRTVETAKLGRYREIDCGLVLFKALMIAHTRSAASRDGPAAWPPSIRAR